MSLNKSVVTPLQSAMTNWAFKRHQDVLPLMLNIDAFKKRQGGKCHYIYFL